MIDCGKKELISRRHRPH